MATENSPVEAVGTTNVYHITYSPEVKTAYVHFFGCNFNCLFCIRRRYRHDIHLGAGPKGEIRFMSLEEVLRVLEKLGAERAVMLGYEPTVDPELPELVERLRNSGVRTRILTNGYELDERLLCNVDEICLSIKAYNGELHRMITGATNESVLRNFVRVYERGIPLSSESVYVPGLVGLKEILEIARFISSVDPEIHYHIDAYVPVNDMWRAPTPEEVEDAARGARKYLKHVSYLCGNEKLSYKVVHVV